jgi:hypothetical protein
MPQYNLILFLLEAHLAELLTSSKPVVADAQTRFSGSYPPSFEAGMRDMGISHT